MRGLLCKPRFEHRVADGEFMKQQLVCFNERIGMEPLLYEILVEQIEDGEQRHALMMGHPFADEDRLAGTFVVRGLIEAECANPAGGFHVPQVAQGCEGVNAESEKCCVGSDHRAGGSIC